MPPQVGTSEETESPTNERIASTITAIPISRLISAIRIGRTLGRISRSRIRGLVTRTMAHLRLTGKMADDDLVRPPPIPAYDHPARRLALSPLHAQLSRRRGSARGARSGCFASS